MARCYLSIYCPGIESNRLLRLVEWCERYSPLVAPDGPDGILADITGCAHLFGGEGPLLLDVRRRLHRMGMESYAAIADAPSIAWALARFGKRFLVHGEAAVAELDRMPVEALRLPLEIAEELRRLGLSTIASVRKMARSSLAARFGSTLIWRLDRLFQQAEDPLTPCGRRRPTAPRAFPASRFRASGMWPIYCTNCCAKSARGWSGTTSVRGISSLPATGWMAAWTAAQCAHRSPRARSRI